MTEENIKLRDTLKAAESVIVAALRSQPEGDAECKSHLEKALEDVCSKVSFQNAAKLREALVKIRDCIEGDEDVNSVELANIAYVALAASPPRNCDIGTAEEQRDRFTFFCIDHHARVAVKDEGIVTRCFNCPIMQGKKYRPCSQDLCQFIWAQMPYEGGGNNGSK